MNEKSKLYQALTSEETASIIAAHFPGEKIQAVKPLSGGLFNTTCQVDLSDQSLILRAGPVNRHLLLPFEENLMQGEEAAFRLLREAGIPTSEVVACDCTRTRIDRDYMLVKRIPSLPLSSPEVPEEVKPALREEAGRLVRRMHQIRGTGFGLLGKVLAGQTAPSWESAMLEELESQIAKSEEYQVFEPDLIAAVRKLAEDSAPALAEIQTPFFAHGDVWEGNFLVRQQDGAWQMAAVIDPDRGWMGDPDYDLGCGWMTGPDFERGYGKMPEQTSAREARLRFYRVLTTFTNAYVWRVEYCDEKNHQDCLRALRELVELG